MRIIRRQPIDQRPERGAIIRRGVPAGEIGAMIQKGESRREIEPNQHAGLLARETCNPIGQISAGPATGRRNQPRGSLAPFSERNRQPRRARNRLARPINCGKGIKFNQRASPGSPHLRAL